MTSDDFIEHLQAAGLLPADVLVSSVVLSARPGELLTLRAKILPGIEIMETLK